MDEKFASSFLKPRIKGNFILDMNPLSKGLILLIVTLSTFIIFKIWYGFTVSAFLIFLALLANRFKSFIAIYWKIFVFFASLLFLVRAAFTKGNTILFQFGGIHVTPEGIHLGLISAALVMAFSGAFILFIETTEIEEFVYMLEIKGLSPIYSYIILSAFQSIIDLGRAAETIMDSQRCRGIETEGGLLSRMKAFIPILGPLVLGAISDVEEKSIAMDARAFSAKGKHTSLLLLRPMPIKEKILNWIVCIAFLLVCAWRIFVWIK